MVTMSSIEEVPDGGERSGCACVVRLSERGETAASRHGIAMTRLGREVAEANWVGPDCGSVRRGVERHARAVALRRAGRSRAGGAASDRARHRTTGGELVTMYGADADELDHLANRVSNAADEIDRGGGWLSRTLNNVMWLGDNTLGTCRTGRASSCHASGCRPASRCRHSAASTTQPAA